MTEQCELLKKSSGHTLANTSERYALIIPTYEGWLYLAGILDQYSRKLVGWSMDSSFHTRLPLSTLKMAIDRRRPEPGLIHHSDRGIQYTSQDYRNQLDENAMIVSMIRKGNCYYNAAMEY